MAEVPSWYTGIEDPSNTGATLDWWTAQSLGLVSYPWQNPSNAAPTGTYVGGTLTGDMGSNPNGVGFGGTPIDINQTQGGFQGGGFNPPAGWDVDSVDLGPWSMGGGEIWSQTTNPPANQISNIGIGIPGIIGIGAGGLMTGGLLDLLGGSSGGGGYGGGDLGFA